MWYIGGLQSLDRLVGTKYIYLKHGMIFGSLLETWNYFWIVVCSSCRPISSEILNIQIICSQLQIGFLPFFNLSI